MIATSGGSTPKTLIFPDASGSDGIGIPFRLPTRDELLTKLLLKAAPDSGAGCCRKGTFSSHTVESISSGEIGVMILGGAGAKVWCR